MTMLAQVVANVSARILDSAGLSSSVTERQIGFSFDVGDCDKAWGDRRTFASGYDEVDFSSIGISAVKLLCLKNLSKTNQIALSAGWTGSQFSVFRQDTTSWNFSPMINLGSLTLRGYPIREGGAILLSCPNSDGFATTSGGSILRIGGTTGQEYEIYVMGT
ncbi:MAG: hypothetical protein EBR82_15095 [Caulobacteraceae bacterium]|nr:hypothetical protein [Caulobacteraceae bacterium]